MFEQYYQEGEEKATEKARAKVNSLVTFPKNCAYLPILTGYNLLPLIQCMRAQSNNFGNDLDFGVTF